MKILSGHVINGGGLAGHSRQHQAFIALGATLELVVRQRDDLEAKLQELDSATQAVCGPIFTASDGGDMWCSMRNRPRTTEAVERLKSALA